MHPWQALGFLWDEDWESGNEAHLSRHGITADEVEQVFLNGPVWQPNKTASSADWKMIGRTDGGRWLTVIVQVIEQEQAIRAFTGWPAEENEKAIYTRQRGR